MKIADELKVVTKVANRFGFMIDDIEDNIKRLEGMKNRTAEQDGELKAFVHLRKFYTEKECDIGEPIY